MATFVPEEMDDIMNTMFYVLDALMLSNRGGGTRCKTVLHAYVVILSLLYYTYTRQTDRVYVVASHFISLSPEYSTTTYWKPSSIEHLGFYMSPGGLLCNEESFTNPNL